MGPMIYPNQSVDFQLLTPKIDKIKNVAATVQLKISSRNEEFDVLFQTESDFPVAAQRYFAKIVAPRVPTFLTSRIGQDFKLNNNSLLLRKVYIEDHEDQRKNQ